MVTGYLTSTLATSRYFLALEPSERVSMTFLLAQAFTHWAADSYMSVPILLHVHGAAPTWTLARLPSKGKAGAGPLKDKGRPDFIGIEPGGPHHVFESKGRSLPIASTSLSATVAGTCMPAALAQTSRIATIRGTPPKTRTAAVWVLRNTGARGYIFDPPAAGRSYDLQFDLTDALAKYHRVVLDAVERPAARTSRRFRRLAIADGRELFVEAKLLKLLRGLDNRLVSGDEVLALLETRGRTYRRVRGLAALSRRLSFGLDGVGLLGLEDADDPRRTPPDKHSRPGGRRGSSARRIASPLRFVRTSYKGRALQGRALRESAGCMVAGSSGLGMDVTSSGEAVVVSPCRPAFWRQWCLRSMATRMVVDPSRARLGALEDQRVELFTCFFPVGLEELDEVAHLFLGEHRDADGMQRFLVQHFADLHLARSSDP